MPTRTFELFPPKSRWRLQQANTHVRSTNTRALLPVLPEHTAQVALRLTTTNEGTYDSDVGRGATTSRHVTTVPQVTSGRAAHTVFYAHETPCYFLSLAEREESSTKLKSSTTKSSARLVCQKLVTHVQSTSLRPWRSVSLTHSPSLQPSSAPIHGACWQRSSDSPSACWQALDCSGAAGIEERSTRRPVWMQWRPLLHVAGNPEPAHGPGGRCEQPLS